MEKEIWRPVTGYEGLYEVSSLGRVKSLSRRVKNRVGVKNFPIKERILAQCFSHNGYNLVNLHKENKSSSKRTHRLVAEAFIPNPENKPQVNHINGVKTDNRLENLEWCTPSENQKHAFKNGLQISRRGESHHLTTLSNNDVLIILRMIKVGVYQNNIAEIYNISPSVISNIKKGKVWGHIRV